MIIFTFLILMLLFWLGFKITGAFLKAFIWLFILLPIALVVWSFGIALCCTLILIPVGVILFKFGGKVLTAL